MRSEHFCVGSSVNVHTHLCLCVCVCGLGWVCVRIQTCSSGGKNTQGRLALLSTATRPRCRINDCDKRATPSGTLLKNPFPKYLLARVLCTSPPSFQHKQEVRGKNCLGRRVLFLLWHFLVTFTIGLIIAHLQKAVRTGQTT